MSFKATIYLSIIVVRDDWYTKTIRWYVKARVRVLEDVVYALEGGKKGS